LDEVYVYGSFRQSRMHQAGLGCSDCHNPHSTKTHAEGNLLCVSCHNPGSSPLPAHIDSRGLQRKDYDSPAHHFHTPGQPGSFCVDCHAPQRTYMVVDPRRDHSFRIPRPDLNAKTGAPDACTGCHTDQTPNWASAAIRAQHPGAGQRGHYGLALAAGRNADSGAVRQLAALVENRREPAIVRATALQLLQRYPGHLSLTLGLANLADSDAQVRCAAVELVGGLAPQRVAPALDDAVRAVRVEAARILAAQLPANHPALGELEQSYEINAERPEALAGWSQLKLARGEQAAAEQLLVTARARNPQHLGIVLNLAELYRHSGREAQAETLLREVLADHPAEPRLTEALVLSLVRQQRRDDATRLLAQALEQHPDDPRFALLYGLLLQEGGDQARALTVFQRGLHAAPGDRQLLLALVGLQQARGDQAAARQALDRLRAINPADPALGG
ncbi:MAG: tetratricopeptide repeat protein, partial [Spongiibacteraceae bacterium]|nr:tetratricopeptide repeat protein [Spongiibacteraceae bacterium]